MSIENQIKALEHRIKVAREKGKLKEAGQMSRTLYNLKAQRKLKIKTA